jgi:hypothetical protein
MELTKEEWLRHARFELELVHEVPEYVEFYLKIVEAFWDFQHDERTLFATPETIEKLLRHKNLSGLTSNPSEWRQVGEGIWQNKRHPLSYSVDGGKSIVTFPPLDSNMNSSLIHNGLPSHVNEKIDELKDL